MKYLVVLGVLAALSLADYGVMRWNISIPHNDDFLINLSGRQRMFSQRIASLSLQLTSSRGRDERERIRQRLRGVVDAMEKSHEILIGRAGPRRQEDMSEAMRSIYFEEPYNLDEQVRRYVWEARLIAGPHDNDHKRLEPALKESLSEAAEVVLPSLDAAVHQHQIEGAAHVADLMRLQGWVLGSTLLALSLMVFLVFRPMVLRIGQEQRELSELNASLEQRVTARTKDVADLRDRFIHNVNHELRTPITCLNVALLAILDETPPDDANPQRNEYLEIAVRNVKHLAAMIDDLLAATGAEIGKLSIEPVPVSVAGLIAETVSSLELIAAPMGISLHGAYSAGDLPSAYADPVRVRQILVNLVGNAIKFTPQGGKISVGAKLLPEDPNYLAVSVADTGCGIKPEEMGRLFDRTYQTSAHGHGQKGLGLGLYISRELVTRQGGKIWVASEPGKGSTFTFTLPISTSVRG